MKTREDLLAEFVGKELSYLEQDLELIKKLDDHARYTAEKNGIHPARVPSSMGEERLRERIKSGYNALKGREE